MQRETGREGGLAAAGRSPREICATLLYMTIPEEHFLGGIAAVFALFFKVYLLLVIKASSLGSMLCSGRVPPCLSEKVFEISPPHTPPPQKKHRQSA